MKKLGAILLIVLLLFFGYKTFMSPKENEESSGTTNEVLKNDVEVEKEEIDEEGNVIEEEIIGNEKEDDENIFVEEENNESSNNSGNTNNNGSTGNTSNNTGNTSNNTGNTSNNTGNTSNNNTGNTNNNTSNTTPAVEYGTVVINYVDEEGAKIAVSTTDSKAKVGSTYKYNAPAISGYISDNSSGTVTITTKGEKKELTFKYANQDHVPYISTYFIEPTVKTSQEAKIKFYVTDYSQKEYREGDTSKEFTITIKVDGKQNITKKLKAGVHEVSIGSFANEGRINFSILATDKYGRNSHELFHYFRVHNGTVKKEYVMTQADLQKYNIKATDPYPIRRYVDVEEINDNIIPTMEEAYNNTSVPSNSYVVLIPRNINDNNTKAYKLYKYAKVKYASNYDSSKVLEEAKNTRIGLQTFLDDIQSQGYNYVKLINGVYRIDHEESIYLPSNFTLDLNGATIKLNQFTGDSATLVSLTNTYDSHLINGIIEGDYYEHDYTNSPSGSEWVNGISINGISEYSSFDNLEVRDITGYGVMTRIAQKGDYTYFYPIAISTWAFGDIDRNTGKDIASETRVTSDFVDLKKVIDSGSKYLSISKYLGYQGRTGNTWNMLVSFYDKDKKFISSVDAYQYRRILKPDNAQYLRVTCFEAKGTDIEIYKNLKVTLFKVPTNSVMKNMLVDNARCVGIAPQQMNNFLFTDIEFTRNGQTAAFCALDAEDGWDGMQDTTFRRLNFHDNYQNDFLTCAGHNFIVEDMIQGKVSIYSRTNSFVYENNTKNTNGKLTVCVADRARNGYYRLGNNVLASANVKFDSEDYAKKNWPHVIRNNTFKGQVTADYYLDETTLKFKMIAAKVYDSNFIYDANYNNGKANALSVAYYERCNFEKSSGENQGGYYKNCTLNNITGNNHRTFEIYDSVINTMTLNTGSYDPHIYISNSTINNFKLTTPYWNKGQFVELTNNTITTQDNLYRLPFYGLGYPITMKNNNITLNSGGSLFEFYDDRDNGSNVYDRHKITITGNTVKSVGGAKYLIKGLTGKTNVNNPVSFEIKNNQLNGLAIFEDGIVSNNKITIK